MDGSPLTKEYPVVLRFEGMFPSSLGGYEMHRTRRGGDLGHVDEARSHLNRRLIGDEDWATKAKAEIDAMRAQNYAAELEALEARGRKQDVIDRMAGEAKDPWRPSKHGPMREVTLTANKKFFEADPGYVFGDCENQRVEEFQRLAVGWLLENFGEDVVHARADLDEEAYHIHAVILPRVKVDMTRTDKKTNETRVIATRLMLQPSKFPLIGSYELAQDSVGEWFKPLGLMRGERRAQAIREAIAEGKEPPKKRFHVTPRIFRLRRARELARGEKALEAEKKAVAAREAEAEAVLTLAAAVADGAIDPERSEPGKLVAPEGASTSKAFDAACKAAKTSPAGAARALGAFKSGWQRLRDRARERALAEAKAEFTHLSRAAGEMGDLINEIKSLLPPGVGGKLGRARSRFAELSEAMKRGFALGRVSYERNVLGSQKKESSNNNNLNEGFEKDS
ncbi:MAG: plasmid recombination protein [Maritimibacter sp.]